MKTWEKLLMIGFGCFAVFIISLFVGSYGKSSKPHKEFVPGANRLAVADSISSPESGSAPQVIYNTVYIERDGSYASNIDSTPDNS